MLEKNESKLKLNKLCAEQCSAITAQKVQLVVAHAVQIHVKDARLRRRYVGCACWSSATGCTGARTLLGSERGGSGGLGGGGGLLGITAELRHHLLELLAVVGAAAAATGRTLVLGEVGCCEGLVLFSGRAAAERAVQAGQQNSA